MALGATSCTPSIIEAFRSSDLKKTFLHGHSYTANPIACASGLASFELLTQKECKDNLERISECHNVFKEKIRSYEIIKDVRSIGTILALEFKTDGDSSYFSELRNVLYPFFIKKEILLRPLGNLIYIIPPYIISNNDLNRIYSAIEEFLKIEN